MDNIFQENIFVRVQLRNSNKLLIGLLYRSPSNNSTQYNEGLHNIMHEATNLGYTHQVLMGVFNHPSVNWETWSCENESTTSQEFKFIECVRDCFLTQHVTKPTRWRRSDKLHVLDLIMSNEEEIISDIEYQSPLGKSDHCVIQFNINCQFRN